MSEFKLKPNQHIVPMLALLHREARTKLEQSIASSFPSLCRGQVEDVVSAAWLTALEHLDRFERARLQGGLPRMRGLLQVIAWRLARRICQTPFYRAASAENMAALDCVETRTQADVTTALQLDLRRLLHVAARRCSEQLAKEICAAVMDQLQTGDTDLVVARRHGIPREYLSRVRSQLRQQAADPSSPKGCPRSPAARSAGIESQSCPG